MEAEAAQAFFNPCKDGGAIDIAGHISHGGSLLAATFNSLWTAAINGYQAGDLHAVAMMHSDMGAEPGWIDILREEMVKTGADMIAATVPIKDSRNLTSTAVDDTGDPWLVRRLTQSQVMALPETFTEKDVGGPLLLNTGLWLCRLGPWCYKTFFTIQDKVERQADGTYRHYVIPEDWDFSRQLRRHGLKLAATRRVKINHWGAHFWSNQTAHGWDHDKQNAPRKDPPKEEAKADAERHDNPLAPSVARASNGVGNPRS